MIYLDHAAATPVLDAVVAAWPRLAREAFANPESIHKEAYRQRRRLADAGRTLSVALLGRECPVVWGNSGTELFNLLAALPMFAGKRAQVGPMEHPAIAAALRRTMKVGGTASGESCDLAVRHLVQSELGLFGGVPSGGEWSLCDSIQGVCRVALPDGADFYTVSGHKIGAPGGAALLLASARAAGLSGEFKKMRSQEYRSGREELCSVLSLALAVSERMANREEENGRIAAINAFLRAELDDAPLPNGKRLRCTVSGSAASDYILHLTLPGYQGAVVTRLLGEAEVCVSAGSACQAETDSPSPALLALGYPRSEAWSGLRLSFGWNTTQKEVCEFLPIFWRILQTY